MYKNDEKRCILKDINFLVYLTDEKDIQSVLKEIDESGEYEGEDVFFTANNSTVEWLAKKVDGDWKMEEKAKPLFYR